MCSVEHVNTHSFCLLQKTLFLLGKLLTKIDCIATMIRCCYMIITKVAKLAVTRLSFVRLTIRTWSFDFLIADLYVIFILVMFMYKMSLRCWPEPWCLLIVKYAEHINGLCEAHHLFAFRPHYGYALDNWPLSCVSTKPVHITVNHAMFQVVHILWIIATFFLSL